jgi:hypothetical protein
MVSLSFFNIGVICTGQNHGMEELDVVHATDNSVLAFSETTTKFEDTEYSE